MTTETAEFTAENGTEGKRARVKFGPKPHQTIPHEWAERVLSHVFANSKRAWESAIVYAAGEQDSK